MDEVTIKYPEHLEDAVKLSKSELERELRLMAALKMFELGKLSSGKAAELAGMTRLEFLEACGQYGVSVFNYQPDEVMGEIEKDLATLERLSGQ